jgi:hypothetical protein
MEDPHAENVISPSPPVVHQTSAGIDPLIQVEARTAGAVHRGDVLIFVESMTTSKGSF